MTYFAVISPILLILFVSKSEANIWEKPGCFKVDFSYTPGDKLLTTKNRIHQAYLKSKVNVKSQGQTPCNRHTRTISIPGCVEFDITTNACRGFCVSYSIPSSEDSLRVNPKQSVTSYGQCCNIMEAEDVKVKVMCIDGPKALTFKSAVSCACYHCKKG